MPRYRIAVARVYRDVCVQFITADTEVEAHEEAVKIASFDPLSDFQEAVECIVIESEETD